MGTSLPPVWDLAFRRALVWAFRASLPVARTSSWKTWTRQPLIRKMSELRPGAAFRIYEFTDLGDKGSFTLVFEQFLYALLT